MDYPPKGDDMRLFTVFLPFLLILTACASPAQPTMTPVDLSEAESDAPALDGTFETSLLVTEWKGGSEDTMLFPLDPASGTALPGYPPISLGYTSFHALSPDRSTLAVVSYPSQSSYNGSLMLIDLPAWKTQRFELELMGWVSTMTFSHDGKQLAIAHGESSYKLSMVNVEQGVITEQSQLDSFVTRLKFTESGDALMIYSPAINTAANGVSAGTPQVLLLSAADLRPRWSDELEGVRDGIFPKDETITQTQLYEPGNASYLSPGLVFAPDQDILYIVHADTDQLTTVNFETQEVKTVEIQTKLTWIERLLFMTAGVAYAKIGDGVSRNAAISPDGQFLYVVGVDSVTSQDQQGNWQMEQTSLGLEILQTSDGSRVERIETDTTELSISPDGRFLYLRNWGGNQNNIPWTEIFDTSSGKLIIRKTRISGLPALLMNGEFLLVSTYSTAETSHHMSVLEPDGSSVLAEWTAPAYIWWLTTP
jgi:6-phosphogluconolactonase (cycloisomerase 2 family)